MQQVNPFERFRGLEAAADLDDNEVDHFTAG